MYKYRFSGNINNNPTLLGSRLIDLNETSLSERDPATMDFDQEFSQLRKDFEVVRLTAQQLSRDAEVARLIAQLENREIDVNLQDSEGFFLLHKAVHLRSKEFVRMLVEKEDVDVNIRNRRGQSPLWVAASAGYEDIVKLLLEHDRVDPEAKDENDQTPLSAAIMHQGNWKVPSNLTALENVVEVLIATGRVDPDAKDAYGLTPLAWASRARNGSVRSAEMLLNTGRVDASSKDDLGITPLLWTAPSYNDKMQEFLLNSGKLDDDPRPNRGSGDVDSRYITHWIESCNAQHGAQCKPTPLERKSPQQLPHWVIDVGRGCLVPGDSVPRYVALSYVWSQGSASFMNSPRPTDSILLEKLNLAAFQTPKYLEEVWTRLPTAVKDAILLVPKLGENYLWIDCLCIVQDDEKTREQVDHMGDIYSGAHFTIIAATFWGGLSNSWVGDRGHGTVEGLYSDLYNSTWATRGWTFQEQMLSKRAVVFSHRFMFWECQECVWSPDGPRPGKTTTRSHSYKVPHYEKANRILSSCYPDFDLYTEMISLYNSRCFTYPQDVLPAFAGILAILGRNFPSGFHYGLPRIHLDIALLWQPFRKARRRVRTDQDCGTIAPKAHLPSWSWCGWTCPVDPYHLRTRSSYFNQDNYGSQIPIWRTQKLVQWYSLPEDMRYPVPADKLLRPEDRSSTNHRNDISSSTLATHMGQDYYPTEEAAETLHSECQESDPSPTPSSTQLDAGPQYISQPHDTWPFISCETSCLTLYIKAVLYSYPASWRYEFAMRIGYPSIFKLSQFANGPTVADACDLISLENQEGLSAGMLRHMEEAELKQGDTVELIAISTGTINSTGVEGDEEDEFYRHEMEAYVGMGPVYAKTSEYQGQYDHRASITCNAELTNPQKSRKRWTCMALKVQMEENTTSTTCYGLSARKE